MARSLLLLLALALTGFFALLNWPVFIQPTTLNLGFSVVEAPLGLIMLGVVALLCVAFVAWALSMQASVLFESRRQAKELQAQRELADKAEASRFTELRSYIGSELARMAQAADEARVRITNRLDLLEHKQRLTLEQTANSLNATLGEIEDRLERGARLAPAEPLDSGLRTPQL